MTMIMKLCGRHRRASTHERRNGGRRLPMIISCDNRGRIFKIFILHGMHKCEISYMESCDYELDINNEVK